MNNEQNTREIRELIFNHFSEHIIDFKVLQQDRTFSDSLQSTASLCITAILSGAKILVCGNGGSAADAQHLAAELVVRLEKNRRPAACLALTTDTSVITACGNDFGFEQIFSRQVEALGRPGDVLVAISTSGNSPNILLAASAAKNMGVNVIGLTGKDGGKLASLCDALLCAPTSRTMRVQEVHSFAIHLLCDLIERAIARG